MLGGATPDVQRDNKRAKKKKISDAQVLLHPKAKKR